IGRRDADDVVDTDPPCAGLGEQSRQVMLQLWSSPRRLPHVRPADFFFLLRVRCVVRTEYVDRPGADCGQQVVDRVLWYAPAHSIRAEMADRFEIAQE